MSILKEKIDYKQLEEELHQALRDDELYQLQNDTKIRAIEQRVPTYNDFRELVNAAHLKPLKRSNINEKIPIPKNIFANQPEDWALKEIQNSELVDPISENGEIFLKSTPKDTRQFLFTWKKITDPNLKFEYLLDTRVYLGKNIFLSEVPTEFLEDVIILSSLQLSSDKMQDTIDFFIKLSHCNRFELNIFFLSDEKKGILKNLLEKLISTELNECTELSKRYQMILN